MPVPTTQRAFLQSLAGSAACVASRTVETKERREKLVSKAHRRRQATVQHQQAAALLGLTTEVVVIGMLTANHQKYHEPF